MDTAGNLWRILWRGKPTRKKNSQVSFILVVARRWERKLSVPLSTGGLTGFNESAHLQPPSRTPPQFSIYERIKSPPPHWEEHHDSITWRPCSGGIQLFFVTKLFFRHFLWNVGGLFLKKRERHQLRDNQLICREWPLCRNGHSTQSTSKHTFEQKASRVKRPK